MGDGDIMDGSTLLQRVEEIGRRPGYSPRGLPTQKPYNIWTTGNFIDLARLASTRGAGLNERELSVVRARWEPVILEVANDGYLFEARELAIKYGSLMATFQRSIKSE